MPYIFEAMADIKLTTENIQKVIKMFPRDNDWKKLITKHRRDIDGLRRGKDISQKAETDLINWAMDNGEISTDDYKEVEDFLDRIMNEGTVRRVVSEDRNKDLKDLETLSLAYVDQLRKGKDVKVLDKQISVLKKKLGVKEEVEESESVELDEGLPNQKQLEKDIMAFIKDGRSDGITGMMGVSKSLEQKYKVGPAAARSAVKKLLSDIVDGTYKG